MRDLYALLLSLALIAGAVLVHFRALQLLSGWQVDMAASGRVKVLCIILGLIVAHAVEAALFAAGYWIGESGLHLGRFIGVQPTTPLQYFYFSLETFTTQGVGDVYPVGPLRLLAALEPLAGLILIGWSTTFTFMVMSLDWRESLEARRPAQPQSLSGAPSGK